MSVLGARLDLLLVPFLSQAPNSLVPIDGDHPDNQSELNDADPNPKQFVPERVSRGQHAGYLQEGDWDVALPCVAPKKHSGVQTRVALGLVPQADLIGADIHWLCETSNSSSWFYPFSSGV